MMNITEFCIESKTLNEINSKKKDLWQDSPFLNFKNLNSRTKGAKGEALVSEILSSFDILVETRAEYRRRTGKPASSDCDRVLSKKFKLENKLSFSWNNELNNFKWQQIRNQDYDIITFIGINPNEIKIWWATKQDLENNIFNKNEFRQHAGAKGGQELYWIGTSNNPVPDWFKDINNLKDYLTKK